jgi:hypothetical protein
MVRVRHPPRSLIHKPSWFSVVASPDWGLAREERGLPNRSGRGQERKQPNAAPSSCLASCHAELLLPAGRVCWGWDAGGMDGWIMDLWMGMLQPATCARSGCQNTRFHCAGSIASSPPCRLGPSYINGGLW